MAFDTGMNTGVNVGVDASPAEAGARQFVSAMQSMGVAAETTVGKIQRTLSDLGDSLFSLKGILAEIGVAFEFKNLVETNVQFARWQVMLNTVAGSTAKGSAEFQFMNEEVDKLGLRLSVAAENYAQMAAASKNSTLQGEETRKIFHALSEELTVMHAGPEQVSRAMMQVREMMSIGNVTMQHMKYLATSIPDIFDLAATGLGVSQTKLHAMMKEGLSATVFFPAAMKAMDDRYAAGAAKAADMTQALMNRVANAWLRLQQMINDGGFGKAFDNALRHVREVLESDDIKEAAKNVGQLLAKAINLATDAMMFFAKHTDLVVLALGAMVGLGALKWVVSLVADVGLAITAFKEMKIAALEAQAAASAADLMSGAGVAGVGRKARSLGAAAASEVPLVTKETGSEAIAGMTEVEVAEMTSRTKGVNIGGVSPNIEALRAEKAAMEANFAAEAAGATTAAEAVTNLGNANGKLAYWGKIAEDTSKEQSKEVFNQRTLFDNLIPAEAKAAEQGELFAISQTAMATATKSATAEVVAMEGAVVTAEATTAAAATEVGIFGAIWAGISGVFSTIAAVIGGVVAGMGTLALVMTGIGAVVLAAAGAMYYFRDSTLAIYGTTVKEGTLIKVIWGDITYSIRKDFEDAKIAIHDWEDEVVKIVKSAGSRIRAVVNDLEPMWRPVLDTWKEAFNGFFDFLDAEFNKFDEVFLDNFMHRMRAKLDGFVGQVNAYLKDAAERGHDIDDPDFLHHATITKGKHPFTGGIGPGPPPPPPEPKKDPFKDLMEKIADETRMVEDEDAVYRKHIGTLEDYRLEIELLTARHKALTEFLRLPFQERLDHPEYLKMLEDANEKLARQKNLMEQAKAVQSDVAKSVEGVKQQELMTKAVMAGGDAVLVATERWKEYLFIVQKGITDPKLIADIQKQTEATIASKRSAATQDFYEGSVKPMLSGTSNDASAIERQREQADYELQLKHIADLRDAKILSAKEAAVVQEQLDEAREDRDNRYLMATKDGLNGMIVGEREMARQMNDHATQMRDIYTKNMQAFQTMLDDFITTGKLNWKSFFDGLNKDIVHQITTGLIMKPLNNAMGSLFGQIDNGGEKTTGGSGIGGFFTNILGTVFGKNNGPWNEKTPLGGSSVPGLGKRVDIQAALVNLRAGELQGGKLGGDIINLLKNPTDEMAKAADQNGVVWGDIAKDVGVKFTSAADTINAVMATIQQGKGGSGGILNSVFSIATTLMSGRGGSPISAGDTQLGTLPSVGNNIPSMTDVAQPPPGMALGGVMTPHGIVSLRRYAGGGIAQAGNPQAAIFGEGDMNEAFVPLPDGRSIPVKMAGAGRGRETHFHAENHFHFPNATVDSFRKSRDQIAADMALVQQHAMSKIN